MNDYDNVEMAKDGDTGEIVFTAVKTSKTRNLNDEVVEAETREEIARIPDNREIGMDIGTSLLEKYSRDTNSKSQKINEVQDR